jgi:Spy/CpxP family protein refolding chaperone
MIKIRFSTSVTSFYTLLHIFDTLLHSREILFTALPYSISIWVEAQPKLKRRLRMKRKKGFIILGATVLVALIVAGSLAVEARGSGRWAGGFHGRGCGGWFHGGPRGGKAGADFIVWRLDEMAKDLNLAPPQKEKFDALRTGVKSRIGVVMEDHIALRKEIRGEMEKDVPDIAAIAPKVKKSISEMSADVQTNIDLFTAFYGSLDNQQKKKLADMFHKRMKRGPRRSLDKDDVR